MSDLTTLISKSAHAAGINLSDHQAGLCRIHIETMLEWNRHLNLTRITDTNEILVKHLLDSLLPAPYLPSSGPALDVGTGAGFPGIPLKIFSPDLEMVLLDSNRKKVSFLAASIAKMGLKGIRPAHGRWEDFAASSEKKDIFQLITMRAVRIEERHLSILASRLLRSGGVFAWWAGPEAEKSLEKLFEIHFPHLRTRPNFLYSLPGIANSRSIISREKL